jgi:CBS domain-containing protein
MKVKDVMTTEVKFCALETNLAIATQLMWENDCGILPVLDGGRLVGVITDRDVCIALGTRETTASRIHASSVVSPQLFVCSAEDDLRNALATMAKERVRRLPVIDEQGELVGIVSLDDIVVNAEVKGSQLSSADVIGTYKALCERRIAVRRAAG